MRRVLFIQHTDAISGSARSLLYTVQGLDRQRYSATICLARPSKALEDLYQAAEIETIHYSGLTLYEHTTARWYGYRNPIDWWHRARQAIGVKAGVEASRRLLERFSPDLVHLNSVVLLPSAIAAAELGFPLVWHVREHPVPGLFKRRLGWIRHCLLSLADAPIFICENDRLHWLGDPCTGHVVNNFVDFSEFDRRLDPAAARKRLGLPTHARVLLYLGGISKVKGVIPLLRAIALVRRRFPQVVCLMPAALAPPAKDLPLRIARRILPLFGSGTHAQKVEAEIKRLGLVSSLFRLPPDPQIAPYFAAADVVVFPSVAPHFARPIIEAGAMGKPVVASKIGGAAELVRGGETGLLAEPGNPCSLAEALTKLLEDRQGRARMGEAGYEVAKERFEAAATVTRIEEIYDRVLRRRRGAVQEMGLRDGCLAGTSSALR